MSFPTTSVQALQYWHRVHMEQMRNDTPDLSVRQMSILLSIYLEPPPHTVRGLAARLRVTKPVITRALNAMGKHDLVTRKRDPKDLRNVLIQRTVNGTLFLDKLGDLILAQTRVPS
jgi:DNA-binding MarR family transcriptional regulator